MMRTSLLLLLFSTAASAQTWRFAVSGDSRNCGDIVMPAIAASAKADRVQFYWHLGDFRRLSNADEDMARASKTPLSFSDYLSAAWPDFIEQQLQPFAPVPVFLGIGNHELSGRTRANFLLQFSPWLGDRSSRQANTYYHWIQNGVDFITMDNASRDMFDPDQMAWLERVLAKDFNDPTVKTVVVGMHEALPHSLTCDHSMNESAQGESSGTLAYHDLLQFREKSGKNVYLIASHAHFWLNDAFDTPYWHAHGGVLPGIIIGAAGAVRYRLPDTTLGFSPQRAKTDTYGYVVATVQPDGTMTFEFHEILRSAIPAGVIARYGAEGVDWCFKENRDSKPRVSTPCSSDAPPGPAPRRPPSD